MLSNNSLLRTDEEFSAAINNKIKVMVLQKGDIIDYGGEIETYTDETVKINGFYFLRQLCEFRVE